MGRLLSSVDLMTTTENSTSTPQIPVRLDFDSVATGFAGAVAHLDRAATKELDRAGIDPLLAPGLLPALNPLRQLITGNLTDLLSWIQPNSRSPGGAGSLRRWLDRLRECFHGGHRGEQQVHGLRRQALQAL